MRFKGFEGEWEETFLEKILSIGNGRDYKHLKQGCVPVFGTGGYMISVNDYLYDGESVFIGRKGTINKPFYYNGKFWTVDTLFYTYNYKNVTPKFVYCLFQTINWLKYNEASGVPSLSKSTIEKIKVKVPSIEEQIKISRLLLLLDERIATQNKIIEDYETLIRGIENQLYGMNGGISVKLGDILTERIERTTINNQYEVLSSTVKGIFSQRDYFSKEIASENNIGYKIIRMHDVVLSPQNLWMGNINYNNKYDIGIVSPSYKIYRIAPEYDKDYVANMLRTHRALYSYMLISEQGASVVRRNLNIESFEQLVFYVPPYEYQVKTGKTISTIQKRQNIARVIKKTYEQQKLYLLTQMFI